MTSALTLPAAFVRTLKVFVVLFALLMLWALLPARAHAASLNRVQMEAVAAMLKAFDVDSGTIGSVQDVLKNSAGAKKTSEAMAVRKPETATKIKAVVASTTVSTDEYRALLKALGYSGDYSSTSQAAWNKGGTREKSVRILAEQLKANPGDGAMEVYTLFPNLSPTYMTPCGIPKLERDALARSLGFSGMFGVLNPAGNIVVEGELVHWLDEGDNNTRWEAACAAVRPGARTNTFKEVQVTPKANVASALSAVMDGVDVLIDAYVGLFDGVAAVFLSNTNFEERSVPITAPKAQAATFPEAKRCVMLTRALVRGAQDKEANGEGEVAKLQKFLAEDKTIYPEGSVSGYFGPATERALKKWQAANGVATSGDAATTGFGAIGPKTRAALARACSGGSNTTSVAPSDRKEPAPTTNASSSAAKCEAPRILEPIANYNLPVLRNATGFVHFESDQPVRYSASDLPLGMMFTGNTLHYQVTDELKTYTITVVAANGCGKDSETMTITVGTSTPSTSSSSPTPPPTGLSEGEKASILSLLDAFGVDIAVVNNVGVALNNGPVSANQSSSTLTLPQVASIAALLESYGASATLVSTIKTVLGAQ